jgi:hypothetical protein
LDRSSRPAHDHVFVTGLHPERDHHMRDVRHPRSVGGSESDVAVSRAGGDPDEARRELEGDDTSDRRQSKADVDKIGARRHRDRLVATCSCSSGQGNDAFIATYCAELISAAPTSAEPGMARPAARSSASRTRLSPRISRGRRVHRRSTRHSRLRARAHPRGQTTWPCA